jgi:hypothetical protein
VKVADAIVWVEDKFSVFIVVFNVIMTENVQVGGRGIFLTDVNCHYSSPKIKKGLL